MSKWWIGNDDMDPFEDDPDAAYERHLETNEQYRAEEEQDMMRTLDTDPIWGVHPF